MVCVKAAGVENKQTVCDAPITGAAKGAYTVTAMVAVFAQPFGAVAVTVKIVVWFVVVLFVRFPLMDEPVPEAAIPVILAVLSRVQL